MQKLPWHGKECLQPPSPQGTTGSEVLCDPVGEDIKNMTDHINFCKDTTVPVRRVCCFPNNKPWITKDMKKITAEQKEAGTD